MYWSFQSTIFVRQFSRQGKEKGLIQIRVQILGFRSGSIQNEYKNQNQTHSKEGNTMYCTWAQSHFSYGQFLYVTKFIRLG